MTKLVFAQKDIAAAKLFTDLKMLFRSRLNITAHNIRGYDFNIDIDLDGVPDIKKKEELQAEVCVGARAVKHFVIFFVMA